MKYFSIYTEYFPSLVSSQRLEKYLEDPVPEVVDQEPAPENEAQLSSICDIEDIHKYQQLPAVRKPITISKKKRKRNELDNDFGDVNASSWREALGPPPSCDDFQVMIVFSLIFLFLKIDQIG